MIDRVYVLALLPAVLWGVSPIFSKRGMASGGTALQASLTVVVVDSTIYVLALLAVQGLDVGASFTVVSAGLFVGAGVVGTAVGRIAVFVGVDRVGASINSAVISIRPLFASLLAVLVLDEPITAGTAVGICILVVGLVVLAISRGGDLTGWQQRDLLFPLLAAAAFGLGNVIRKAGLGAFSTVTVLEAVALNELGALVTLAAVGSLTASSFGGQSRPVLAGPPRSYAFFAASGTITAVALLSLFAALRIGRVVVVDPLAATAPLFTAVFAAFFLRDLERVTARLVLGAVLIVVGVVLIVVGPAAIQSMAT